MHNLKKELYVRGELEVNRLKHHMLLKLSDPRCAGKGCWKNIPLGRLSYLLHDEVEELRGAIASYQSSVTVDSLRGEILESIIGECADVANFCMMILDAAERLQKGDSDE